MDLLFKCIACGKEISIRADKCLQCGHPVTHEEIAQSKRNEQIKKDTKRKAEIEARIKNEEEWRKDAEQREKWIKAGLCESCGGKIVHHIPSPGSRFDYSRYECDSCGRRIFDR